MAAVTVAALALRVWQLGDVPFGFHPDEGHNALDAWRIAEGWRPVYLPRNNGREPLFMYLMAAIMTAGGPSIFTARLAGVLAGVAMVPVQYLFAHDLANRRRRRVALASAALVAVTFWPVAQARYALRANLLPVWVALTLWAWWRALSSGRRGATANGVARAALAHPMVWAALTGGFVAAASYTHLTGRLLPLVLVASGAWAAIRERRWSPVAYLIAALLVAGILMLPQARYFASHPEMLSYRAEQVSVFNPKVNEGDLVGTLSENAWHIALMPVVRGDTSWYHNLSGRPVFEPLAAVAFLIGLVLLALDVLGRSGERRQLAAVLVGSALLVMIAPSLLSVGAPNYVRLTGTWPALFFVAGWGLSAAASWISRRLPWAMGPTADRRTAAGLLAASAVVVSAAVSGVHYFGSYVSAPQVYQAFNAAAVERAEQIADLAAANSLYVSPAIWNQSVIRFVNLRNPPASFDAREGLVLPPTGEALYAFDPAELEDAAAVGRRWPMMRRFDYVDRRGELSLVVYRLRRAEWPGPGRSVAGRSTQPEVVFGERIALLGADLPVRALVVEPGQELRMALEWHALAPTERDMNLFVHLVAGDRTTYGQFDGPPLGGSYGTDSWRPGERILTPVTVSLDGGVPTGELGVRVGWYDWRTLDRLPVPGDDDDAAMVGTLEVQSVTGRTRAATGLVGLGRGSVDSGRPTR